jgi:putative peptidoglycan lipid II flippase
MSFLRAVATLSSLTLASRVFGLARDLMAAAIMGAGPVADAFFVALRLPNFFRRMFAEGAFGVSFVPLFSKTLQQEGKEAATDFANQAMTVLMAALIPLSIIAIIFMPAVLTVLAPGFNADDGRHDLAVTLTRITFFYLAFMSAAALIGGMLNTLDKFAAYATAPVLFNVAQIAFLCVALLFPTPGHAMAWAVLLSGALQVAWLLWCLHRAGLRMKIVKPVLNAKIKRLLNLMGPGMIGASAVQINLLVDTIIASTLPIGAVSYLYYADRLNQLPLGLIGTAVGTALLPKLAQNLAAQQMKSATHLFNRALEWTLVLTMPAAVALGLIAEPIIAVLFERGEFTAEASRATAAALKAYAVGLPAFVLVKVLSTALYAQENTKTPVKITLVCAALNVVLCLVLIAPLQHAGIALATAIAGWVQAGILFYFIERKNDLEFDDTFKRNAQLTVIACVIMGVLLVGSHMLLLPWFLEGGLKRAAALVLTCSLGGFVYIGLVFGLKIIDYQNMIQSLKGKTP